jgi:hypothetical protein
MHLPRNDLLANPDQTSCAKCKFLPKVSADPFSGKHGFCPNARGKAAFTADKDSDRLLCFFKYMLSNCLVIVRLDIP